MKNEQSPKPKPEELALLARNALVAEARATPKPGLVDGSNSGAHRDMGLGLLLLSAQSLIPYFATAAALGMENAGMAALRKAGLQGERAMFLVTNGVNTHKGSVFSMGLTLYGMGQHCFTKEAPLLIAARLIRSEAPGPLSGDGTNGQAVLARYGVRGARGEAADGFPNGRFACRRLRQYREQGIERPEPLVLCELMERMDDTNLLHRGGPEGLAFAKSAARRINGLPVERRYGALTELDSQMIQRNLSPGGCADMLALGLLLEAWEERTGRRD